MDQHCTEPIRTARSARADGGEPLNTEERSVTEHSGSLYVNLTKFGALTHGIEKGQDLDVEIYENGIWIPAGDRS